jgi:hypothetical protein
MPIASFPRPIILNIGTITRRRFEMKTNKVGPYHPEFPKLREDSEALKA